MQNRPVRPLQPIHAAAAMLALGVGGEAAAAAAPGWDTGLATQGLIVLGGFAVVLFVGLALLARFFARLSTRGRPGRR